MSKMFPNVSLRRQADGSIRPRFNPGPTLRAKGAAGEDLKHPDGRWFTLDEVDAWCRAGRGSGEEREKTREKRRPARETVGDLLEDWLRSDDVSTLRPKTRQGYREMADAILYRPGTRGTAREPFSLAPVAAITRKRVKAFYTAAKAERGWHMALGMVRVLSAAWTWALDAAGWNVIGNPCLKLKLKRPPIGDPVIWSIAEWRAAEAFGDHPAIGEPVMVDAIVLALFSGQRPEDVIAFTGGAIADDVVRLVQGKTGKRIALPAIGPLRERLVAMARRRLVEAGYNDPALLIHPATRKAYLPTTFRHDFVDFIRRVAAGAPELGLAPCPSIAGKRFKHLRKTFTTWCHQAGNDPARIASITGHASLDVMGKHYLDLGEVQAREVMARLEAWLQQKGEAV